MTAVTPGARAGASSSKHLLGGFPVVADVDIVRARIDRGPQHRQSESVIRADGVEHQVGLAERVEQSGAVGDIHPASADRHGGIGQLAGEALGRHEITVGDDDALDAAAVRSGPNGDGAHRSGAAQGENSHGVVLSGCVSTNRRRESR